MKFLILDDDVEIHEYYKSLVNKIPGVTHLSLAKNEEEFAWAVNDYKPDVILCDIHMAPIEGPDILRKYKDKIVGANIIMLSCADEIAEETRILREEDCLNVIEYVQKPLTPLHMIEIFGE